MFSALPETVDRAGREGEGKKRKQRRRNGRVMKGNRMHGRSG